MRILTTMVTKNEADRYLSSVLTWLNEFVDDVCVYDDQSTDDTFDFAIDLSAKVSVRPDGVPSFLEHEGAFRQAAWEAMERLLEPEDGDWVLSVDADEFLVDERGPRSALEQTINECERQGYDGVSLHIVELFAATQEVIYQRTDGYWGTIAGTRLLRWRPGAGFPDRALGCGSVPSPLFQPAVVESPEILHFGYVKSEDRQEKSRRYQAKKGHSSAHVKSILEPPTLEVWTGPTPFNLFRTELVRQ